MNDHKRTLVTCALPYANGPVHIGHLAGAYIPGDIYVRYLRMRGEDVVFICGHPSSPIETTTVQDIRCDRMIPYCFCTNEYI